MDERDKKKILVVDDEEEVLIYLSNILKRSDYNVLTASNGKDAVDLAKKGTPDLIILDILLPDMDGGDVAASLERNPSTANIPIIFLTGIITKKEEIDGLKSGRHLVLAKPASTDELFKTIRLALSS